VTLSLNLATLTYLPPYSAASAAPVLPIDNMDSKERLSLIHSDQYRCTHNLSRS
jgi:hypothetical protein